MLIEQPSTDLQCVRCCRVWPQARADSVNLMPQDFGQGDQTGWSHRQGLLREWHRNLPDRQIEATGCWLQDGKRFEECLSQYGGRVLDLGGGLGLAQSFVQKDTAYTVVDPVVEWLDIDVAPLLSAFPALDKLRRFIVGVGEHLPFVRSQFDAVLMLRVLNHVSSPAQVLSECARVLRYDGRLLIVLEAADPVDNADHISSRQRTDRVAISEAQVHAWAAGQLALIQRFRVGSNLALEFVRVGQWVTSRRPASVSLGDLRRLTPIGGRFGYDRGQPIDRYFIEAFLAAHSPDITGRVLEIGDREYTQRFGRNVTISDVLHITPGAPEATIIGDLAAAPNLPSASYDCIICTQTLQLIFDLRAAVWTLRRLLRPGGVALVTVPGISQTDDPAWAHLWCWSFTAVSAIHLFNAAFGSTGVEVNTYGNVLTSTAFLHGLATEDLSTEELAYRDPMYPHLVTIRAWVEGDLAGSGVASA